MCVGGRLRLGWMSEDNFQEAALSIHSVGLELMSSGLAASALYLLSHLDGLPLDCILAMYLEPLLKSVINSRNFILDFLCGNCIT